MDLAQLERALRNADAAGDTAAAQQLAQAIRSMRPKGEAPAGFAMGLGDPIHGGAQLLTKMLPQGVVSAGNQLNNWLADKTGLVARLPEGGVDQQVREREASYKAQRASAGEDGIDWGRIGGNVANPVNLAIAARLPSAASLGGRIAAGAGTGAASGALGPVGEGDFVEEKGKQTAFGAAFGGLVPAIASGVGRIISPKASTSPDLALLKAEGISPTVGQSLGGMANRVEEKMMSVPWLGDAIRNARVRGAEDLQTAVGNRALAPLGEKMPSGLGGREAVAHVQDTLSNAYSKLLPQLKAQADPVFAHDINGLQQMMKTGSIKPEAAAAFNRILGDEIIGKFRGRGVLTGETIKSIESSLGAQISRLGASTDADERLLGTALQELQASLRGLVQRNNPQAAKELEAINQGYAVFKRMQRAAGYVGADDGAFSAAQLQSAVKAMDRSKDKGKFARGDAPLQDLSDAAKSVMGSKVPNSGTMDRGMMVGLPALMFEPHIGGGLLGASAAYSAPAQSLLRGLVSSRPAMADPIARLLNQSSPMFAPAGGLLGIEMLNQ